MVIYYIIFVILALFSAFEVYGLRQYESRIFFTLFSLALFVLSFVRWETGTDWYSYLEYFNSLSEWGTEGEFEWGFTRINEFVKIIFDNYTVLLFVLGLILFAFQRSAILKLSPYPITSLLFLWSTTFANVFFVRQSIATVILFFSIQYIQKRKLLKFLLVIGFAMLFHRTSLVFILAWWVYPLKIRPIIMVLFIAISLILTFVLSKLMGSLGGLLGNVVQQKIDMYLDSGGDTYGTEASFTQIIIKGFANKIFVFGLSLFFLSSIEKKKIIFREYLNLYWVGIMLYFSTISISVALVRLSFAYDMMLIILAPLILKNIEQRFLRFFLFCVFICYLVLRLYISLVGGYYDLFIPLRTIFN